VHGGISGICGYVETRVPGLSRAFLASAIVVSFGSMRARARARGNREKEKGEEKKEGEKRGRERELAVGGRKEIERA